MLFDTRTTIAETYGNIHPFKIAAGSELKFYRLYGLLFKGSKKETKSNQTKLNQIDRKKQNWCENGTNFQ